jgi:hypothetical protein
LNNQDSIAVEKIKKCYNDMWDQIYVKSFCK